MSITINFFLNLKKQRSDSTYPIYIRITENRKFKIKSTGLYILEKHWHHKNHVVRKSHLGHKALNERLELIKDLALKNMNKATRAEKPINVTILKNSLAPNHTNILEFFLSYHSSIKENYYHRAQKIKNCYTKLVNFTGKQELYISEINKGFLNDFVDYLTFTEKNKGTTIQRVLKSFKMLINEAITRELIEENQNPFIGFTYTASQKSNKAKLSHEQINAIKEVQVDYKSVTWNHHNEFLFSFYCAGIRFGDLCQLKWSNLIDGYLVYTMSKTANSKPVPRKIKLVKQALDILELYRENRTSPNDYIFPELTGDYANERELKAHISSRNALANKNLKKIAKLAEIEANVSFHVSRHSYADFARSKGMSLYSISKALGHSKLETTQVYLKDIDQQYVDHEHEGLFK
mgnify:CR=1 FL=1